MPDVCAGSERIDEYFFILNFIQIKLEFFKLKMLK